MNTSARSHRSIKKWIGLAHVAPRPKNDLLDGGVGAYVPVVALARDVEDFCEKLKEAFDSQDFDVLEIDDIELVSRRIKKYPDLAEISKLSEAISPDTPVVIGTFQVYMAKDSEH